MCMRTSGGHLQHVRLPSISVKAALNSEETFPHDVYYRKTLSWYRSGRVASALTLLLGDKRVDSNRPSQTRRPRTSGNGARVGEGGYGIRIHEKSQP